MHVMSGDVESGSKRPRPLSGGFWTLLSWLRGEEHSSSNDSLSSAGSDRTAVSFAFLAPAHYHGSAAPLVLPPQGPPTDSYKKRVHERNLRRHYDRDTSLHRKYGLLRGESGVTFDVHSLPPVRRPVINSEKQERERRAASECFQRRVAHVPGKRRAPPPPTRNIINGTSSLNNRRHARKRPAPQPPSQTSERTKENYNNKYSTSMNSKASQGTEPLSVNSTSMGCKPEKYKKKELNSKDSKARPEKSFLKQIFENRKRNSTLDTSSIKLLPNISELDKQAAEIIESSKMKRVAQLNQENIEVSNKEKVWYCIKCSEKYNKSVDTCIKCKNKNQDSLYSEIADPLKNAATIYTQTERELSNISSIKEMEDKQKLKEMLKEMKDSLPKRTKLNDLSHNHDQIKGNSTPYSQKKSVDAPTLRIGSKIDFEYNFCQEPTSSAIKSDKISPQVSINNQNLKTSAAHEENSTKRLENIVPKVSSAVSSERKDLNTPLKISSLLNPIYIPKPVNLIKSELLKVSSSPTKDPINQNVLQTTPVDPIYVKTADAVRNILLTSSVSSSSKPSSLLLVEKHKPIKEIIKRDFSVEQNIVSSNNLNGVILNNNNNKGAVMDQLNIHTRRRDLVNQLEKSIASGDERAAADAAIKLAQLRLSCSVLSFTSQILEQPSTSNSNKSPKDILRTKSSYTPVIESEHSTDKVLLTTQKQSTSKEFVIKCTSDEPNASEKVTVKPDVVKMGLKIKESPQRPFLIKPEGEITNHDKNKLLLKSDVATQSHGIKIITPTENVPQPSTSKAILSNKNDILTIAVWVEDKEKARGPIDMKIHRQAVVGELRRQAEQSLGLPARLQRWIVGRELCSNDDTPLVSLAGPNLEAPFYLCLVECDKTIEKQLHDLCRNKDEIISLVNKIPQSNNHENSSNVYTELVKLESQAVVPNTEAFECEICMEYCAIGEGVVLRECVHSFCRQCLADVIRHCEEPAAPCPAVGCPGLLHEREIRALVSPEDYARWLDRGLAAAESGTRNAFHCRTRDCTGWALCETGARRFPCPVCKHTNCVLCQAIHENETCDQYQKKLKEAANTITDQRDEGTQSLIESLISRGEALQCPECNAVITKKWGCDWVKCSACKTEICWVTRGRRWGPGGRGDTSGGCRCGVDGKRCHASCGYCH